MTIYYIFYPKLPLPECLALEKYFVSFLSLNFILSKTEMLTLTTHTYWSKVFIVFIVVFWALSLCQALSQPFPYISSFHPHPYPVRKILLLSPFYR